VHLQLGCELSIRIHDDAGVIDNVRFARHCSERPENGQSRINCAKNVFVDSFTAMNRPVAYIPEVTKGARDVRSKTVDALYRSYCLLYWK
jgi:hypothetical protein